MCFTLICTFLCRFCTNYDVKMLNFMFCGRRKQAMKNLISLSELGCGPKEFNSSWVTYI